MANHNMDFLLGGSVGGELECLKKTGEGGGKYEHSAVLV